MVDLSQGHWEGSDPGNTYVKLPLICEFYLADQGLKHELFGVTYIN